MKKSHHNLLINFKDKNFVNLIQQYQYNFNYNDIVAGKIISKEHFGALVDIGFEKTVFLPNTETLINGNGYKSQIEINKTHEFLILEQDEKVNKIFISMRRLNNLKAWKRLKIMEMEETLIERKIISYNKGGALVYIEGLLGFVPNSHLLDSIRTNKKPILLRILEINPQKNILTLSNKCAFISKNLEEFNLGKIIEGKIDSIQKYGLFIQTSGIRGLVHRSEIPKEYQSNLEEVFEVGNTIKAKIIHLDIKHGRISLSLKNF